MAAATTGAYSMGVFVIFVVAASIGFLWFHVGNIIYGVLSFLFALTAVAVLEILLVCGCTQYRYSTLTLRNWRMELVSVRKVKGYKYSKAVLNSLPVLVVPLGCIGRIDENLKMILLDHFLNGLTTTLFAARYKI